MNLAKRFQDKLAQRLTRLQGSRAYRALARHFLPVRVHAASAGEVCQAMEMIEPGSSADDGQPNPAATGYAGYAGGALAGYVELVRYPPEDELFQGYWIMGLYVRARYRGLGVGEALMQAAMEQARREGAHELWLLVYNQRRPARSLYEKLGFVQWSTPAAERLQAEDRQTGPWRVLYRKTL